MGYIPSIAELLVKSKELLDLFSAGIPKSEPENDESLRSMQLFCDNLDSRIASGILEEERELVNEIRAVLEQLEAVTAKEAVLTKDKILRLKNFGRGLRAYLDPLPKRVGFRPPRKG